jgi:hypothetical protein
MLRLLRSKLTFANTVSVMALFVALGGTSYAALRVGSREIVNNSVRSADLRNDNVRGQDIHNGAIASADLQDNGIASGDIRDGAIQGSDLAPDTLTGRTVLESSLGTVPSAANAATLDGKSPAAFLSVDSSSRPGSRSCRPVRPRRSPEAVRSPGARRARTSAEARRSSLSHSSPPRRGRSRPASIPRATP